MSQVVPVKTTIGEKQYTMSMLPPMKSHRLLTKVAKMVGPSLGPVFDKLFNEVKAGKGDVLDQDVPVAFFTNAAGSLFDSLDEKVLDEVMAEFQAVTVVEGLGLLEGKFDVHFLGRLDEMYQWVAWGMSVQWGKVFGGLAAAAKAKVAMAVAMTAAQTSAEESSSQTPSIGSSGE